jgi:stage V sporulation protein AD
VFSAYLYRLLKEKKINKLLLVATGALMSPVSAKQGEPILGVAHAVAIEN